MLKLTNEERQKKFKMFLRCCRTGNAKGASILLAAAMADIDRESRPKPKPKSTPTPDNNGHGHGHNQGGVTPLIVAATHGHLNLCKMLIERGGAQPNICQSITFNSPLHYAAEAGHIDVVTYLISEKIGAIINAQNWAGLTPLSFAACAGQAQCAAVLINGGAQCDIKTKTGATSLMLAAQQGHSEVVRTLLAIGGPTNCRIDATKHGITALLLATREAPPEHKLETVRALLAAGNINILLLHTT